MLASRFLFLVVTFAAWVLNGAALLQYFSILEGIEGLIPAALIANMVAAPTLLWAAYKSGELAEEAYRNRMAQEAAAASAAVLENKSRLTNNSLVASPTADQVERDR